MLVNGLRGYHVIDVACGSGDAHSLAVADDGMYMRLRQRCTCGWRLSLVMIFHYLQVENVTTTLIFTCKTALIPVTYM